MILDLKRILVPLDFSANSAYALDYAHALAKKFDASIHLVHVCEVPSIITGSMDAYAMAYTDWRGQLGEEAERELTQTARAFSDITVSTEVLFGNPARSIVSAAAADRSDLIVMGTHGHGPVMHLVLGNVAERVVRTAPCPVLTVREHVKEAAAVIDLTVARQADVQKGGGTVCAIGAMAVALTLALALPNSAAAQEPTKQSVTGGELFRTYCASCHGTSARGDGPLASTMTRKPTDLTEIAKRNGDHYPPELVFRTIDGRKPIRGHGGPDMPVWGDAFARSRDVSSDEQVKKMIQSLVDFLESIQTRPAQ
jgi:nucleotide-binding universal stress UspA family protein/mono/diheme cytochrome c family protein